MTTFSRISMAAVAALVVGVSSANAADLGGNCCADLEERIAELEATTARKGNRKVSLTISGQISQQLMFWDDGLRNDMYVSGPTSSNSRFRFLGSAKISPEVTAGFMYELEALASQSSSQNQTNGSGPSNTIGNGTGDDAGAASANLREAYAWIEHSRLGRISIGQGGNAANNAILVDLSGKSMAASNDVRLHSSGMLIARSDGVYSNLTWGNFFQGASGDWLNERVENINYRTPTIAGFSLGASFGEDNYWDVEGRYSGEFNGVRIASRVAYSVRSEYNGAAGALICTTNCAKKVEQLAGSLSVRHMPTGLFFTGAAGWRDTSDSDIGGDYDSRFFYLSGGVARNFFGLGDTVLYGEYSEWKGAGQDVNTAAAGPAGSVVTPFAISSGDTLTHWGVGVVQHVDAAAMEFWLAYKTYSLDAPGLFGPGITAEDLHMVTVGTRIRF